MIITPTYTGRHAMEALYKRGAKITQERRGRNCQKKTDSTTAKCQRSPPPPPLHCFPSFKK
uniref:Uncharacterized protein n=1 Tax=Oryza nivara TaxID=4536 RepID=A0A0E0GHN9_ORYNI